MSSAGDCAPECPAMLATLPCPGDANMSTIQFHSSDDSGVLTNDSSDVSGSTRRPDSDAIKMFVGQVPRCMTESQLLDFFSGFGEIHELHILRDKSSRDSKGCCFVTFYTRKAAIEAQSALHNIYTLPGMSHPVQMKPADVENRNERKLFVGMLRKSTTEPDVRKIFSPFGDIEECNVLRDAAGSSRGCAFVTFASRSQATQAMRALNRYKAIEGSSVPLVVQFADTTSKSKQLQSTQPQTTTSKVPSLTTALSPQSLLSVAPNFPLNFVSIDPSAVEVTPASMSTAYVQQQLANGISQQHQSQQQHLLSMLTAQQSSKPAPAASYIGSSPSLPAAAFLPTTQAMPSSAHQPCQVPLTGFHGLGVYPNISISPSSFAASQLGAADPVPGMQSIGSFMNPYAQLQTVPLSPEQLFAAYSLNMPSLSAPLLNPQLAAAAAIGALPARSVNDRQLEGPPGANLFIYHLPQQFDDSDLAHLFRPFGVVLSAKVFIDKQTHLSKCFGFVSYTDVPSAQRAVQAMNGFQIGTKRLKVEPKQKRARVSANTAMNKHAAVTEGSSTDEADIALKRQKLETMQ